MKSFYFHYNKAEADMVNAIRMNLVIEGVSHLVKGIVCEVSTETIDRTGQEGPRLVVGGRASKILFTHGYVHIS